MTGSEPPPPRPWLGTLLLCFFAGVWGIHRFWTGHLVSGLVQFLTFGGGGVWWLYDLWSISSDRYRDAWGRPLTR